MVRTVSKAPYAETAPGLFNFRDLGGHRANGARVRTGRLWRSNAPTDLGDAGRAALADAGIRTLLDMREPDEGGIEPADIAPGAIPVITLPFIGGHLGPDEQTQSDFFFSMLRRRGERIAELVTLLSRSKHHPVAFYCSTGKDRTGLLSALTLSALGVGDEDVAADFHLTESLLPDSYIELAWERSARIGVPRRLAAQNLEAPRELMLEILGVVRATHGDAAAYLIAHGMAEADLAALRASMLEPI
jgi:protein-tyrosine phosphatase